MFRKKDDAATTGTATPGSPVIRPPARPSGSPTTPLSGKQAYEARRAQKAGMGLEKWMAEKDRRAQAEREAIQRARKPVEARKPGLLRRLLDRAHRPI